MAKKITRKGLKRQLDTLYAEVVKARDSRVYGIQCALGCGREADQTFHFITRAREAVRWDPANAVRSCAACNIVYEHNQIFVDKVFSWFKTKFGEAAWDDLKLKGGHPANHSMDDLRAIQNGLKAELQKLTANQTTFGKKA